MDVEAKPKSLVADVLLVNFLEFGRYFVALVFELRLEVSRELLLGVKGEDSQHLGTQIDLLLEVLGEEESANVLFIIAEFSD